MMKKLWNIGLLLALFFSWQACSDSETLTPSDPNNEWDLGTIKNGNQPYDRWIKSFYDSTGVAILYEWIPGQAYWQGGSEWAGINIADTIVETKTYVIDGDKSGVKAGDENEDGVADYVYVNGMRYEIGHVVIPHWRDNWDDWQGFAWAIERTTSTTGMEIGDVVTVTEKKMNTATSKDSGFDLKPADTNYVSKQLNLLHETFFKYYTKDFLKKYMPRRILLGQDFFHYDYVSNDETVYTEVPFYYTYLTLLINWGDEKLDNLEEGEIKFMRYWLNMWFLRGRFWEPELGAATSGYSAKDKKTDIFDEFFAISGDAAYERQFSGSDEEAGFVDSEINKVMDVYYYYCTVSQTTLAQFMGEEEGGYRNGYGKYPKCLQKYHLMRKILIEQGIDLDGLLRDGMEPKFFKDGRTWESYYDKDFMNSFVKDFVW